VPELSNAAHSSVSRRRAPRVARRYLTGLSAAGVTAVIALTGAVSDASASPAANPPARVVTLTSNSSAPTGNLTVQVRYQLEPRGRNKVLSATFSGASKISLRHPALIVSLRPVLALPPRHPGQRVSVRVIAFSFILRLHNARSFRGALPARLLRQLGKVFASPPRRPRLGGYVLSATVASVRRTKRQISLQVSPVGLRVGVLLGPVRP
jgi:hypothetical protein